jgi:endoglucanase
MKKMILGLLVIALINAQNIFAQKISEKIHLNQVGFFTNGPKKAIITDVKIEKYFYITSTNLRDTLYKGILSAEKKSAYSKTSTSVADFTPFNKKGNYVLVINNIGHSYVFTIGDSILETVLSGALKAFYYQRASMPLTENYAGKWKRGAGHPDNKVLIHPSAASAERPTNTVISSVGGWYDAGDYNKYIVNSGITMGTLLSTYEDFQVATTATKTNIPSIGTGIPDLLNESIYNLRWMLTMQDPNDGGVYSKCTNASFDGFVLPGITKAPRYVVQKSTPATLDFIAVTAQASRLLKKYNKVLPGLADSCEKAAIKAWAWAIQHPSVAYDQDKNNKQFEPAITTGGYGDNNFSDEWFWAASEMYCTNPLEKYATEINKYKTIFNVEVPSWGGVGMLGYYSLIRNKSNKLEGIAKMKTDITQMADNFIEHLQNSAFETIMGQSEKDFVWGSNAVAANQGILLINAYLITKDKKYIHAALSNVDYILGRNATGYSFVTGVGSKSPMHPHHRPSSADGITEPIPGLLVGGPNPGRQDGCLYEFTATETAYVDTECSYASNEIAINWNAPLVYLLQAVQALKTEVGYTAVQKNPNQMTRVL